MSKKRWYSIEARDKDGKPTAAATAAKATISIHDDIGLWGITAKEFIAEFNTIPPDAAIELSVHSGGGSVFDGLAIYHVLARAKDRIVARVEGVAASAASMIVMAAKQVQIPANAWMMIHNPVSLAWGDAEEVRSTADLLDKLTASFAAIYAAKSGKSEADVITMMDAETWMTGTEAVAQGFADVVLAETPAVAQMTESARSRFAHVPQALAETPAPVNPNPQPVAKTPPTPEPKPATPEAMAADLLVNACVDAGFPAIAAPLIRAGADKQAVEARIAQAREIKALASAAGRASEADALIANGLSVEDARAHLLAARAHNAPAINPHAPADPKDDTPKAETKINFRSIYAARRGKA